MIKTGQLGLAYLTETEFASISGAAWIRDLVVRLEVADGPRFVLPVLERFRLPSVTTAERDASDPALGELAYISDLDAVQVYSLGGWTTL